MASQLTETDILAILRKYDNNPQQLIAILLDVQEASGSNHVDRKWAECIAGALALPISQVHEVLTFYAMFSTVKRGEYVVEICQSTPCGFDRAGQLVAWFEKELGIKMGQTSVDGKFTLQRTCCVGACDVGPVAKIGDEVYGNLTAEKVSAIVAACRNGVTERMEELACQS